MFKHGDKVLCVSDRLVEKFNYKYDVIYYVEFCKNNYVAIKNSPCDESYVFSTSNFVLLNKENLRNLKIKKIKNKLTNEN